MIYVLSGGAGLNLKVVAGTSAPTSPKENTVWVNTDIDIHSYAFSATQPHRVSKNKNLIVYPFYYTTRTISGVTWTDNGDGTVKANGTATATTYFRVSHNDAAGTPFLGELEPGTYTLSGCPSGGGSTKYRIELGYTTDNWATTEWIVDSGNGVTFTVDQKCLYRVILCVFSGATVSNLVFKPQLEKGSTATSFVKGDATGMVWFSTGTSSNAAMNVDKKNTVMLYPKGCRQYVSGAWVTKTAKVYQNGAWIELRNRIEIVANGVLLKELSTMGKRYNSTAQASSYSNPPNVTQESDHVLVVGTKLGWGAAYRQENLTNVSSIVIEGTFTTGSTRRVAVWSDVNGMYIESNMVASTALTTIGATVDVSNLSGDYYVGITNEYTYPEKITEFYLE